MPDNSSPLDSDTSPTTHPEAAQLWNLVYDELRKVAHSKMSNERVPLTLQPTALVHEAWIRLGGDQQPLWENRAQFFSAAAEAMRRILIERARRRQALRHGGDQHRMDIEDIEGLPESMNDDKHMIDLSNALDKLAEEDPQKAEVVKYRYFVGMTIEETAKTMGVSTPTVWRWWEYARTWLHREMKQE